jgi:xylulose-5-phosphate/fructose-6-phosphate phosphoketolase
MNQKTIEKLNKYFRLLNYISVSQIYLKDNFLLERKLKAEDIKPRLLGHWGTCPGINFTYTHLNYFIKKTKANILFVLGPGHGFPALQANLFLEETLKDFYPKATLNKKGLEYISKNFSWPFGFPSHTNPGTPGAILEGGELGYCLSVSFGSVLDNPDLITACLIGDGEAETGPLAASWHLNKFLNLQNDGVVLPILHLNEYKISGPTILGRMSDKELKKIFEGYGWQPIFVEGNSKNGNEKMAETIEICYKKIKEIKKKNKTPFKLPMIILKTPKGWTGIKEFGGKKIEGNHLSHQVPLKNCKENELELNALEKWLRLYKVEELFDKNKGASKEILSILPEKQKRMGLNKHSFAFKNRKELKLPDIRKFTEEPKYFGEIGSSNMRRIGEYLSSVFKLNKNSRNFKLFSPDETYSNKLDAVFKNTKRVFNLPLKKWDDDLANKGGVIEILSEHSLQGLAQGYALTGRSPLFVSYEAFIEIVSSMADQYAKFLKVSREFPWRKGVPSFNYILTSSGWRQDHNGFSHQNPSFISGMLQKRNDFVKIYFPCDGVSSLLVIDKCLKQIDGINVIVAGKTLEPRWLTIKQAKKELKRGIMIWDFISDKNPDIVFAGIGDYTTKEILATIDYLKYEFPKVKIRFVNILEMSSNGFGNDEFHKKNPKYNFEYYFTKDKPVIFNFYGYPETVKDIFFDKKENAERITINGYIEQGSTTTPFDMQVRNKTSRFHLLINSIELLAKNKVIDKEKAKKIIEKYNQKLKKHKKYIIKNGIDLKEIEKWQWGKIGEF